MADILNAKTINQLVKDLNSLYDTGIPTEDDFPAGSVLTKLWETAITVTGKGKDEYCAQADSPTISFGIGIDIQATAIVQASPKEIEEIKKCKDS